MMAASNKWYRFSHSIRAFSQFLQPLSAQQSAIELDKLNGAGFTRPDRAITGDLKKQSAKYGIQEVTFKRKKIFPVYMHYDIFD